MNEKKRMYVTHCFDLIYIHIKFHEDISNVKQVMGRTQIFGEIWKMNKNGITWKLKKGEKSFLHMTHCIYLRHISKKLHEDITSGYRIMGCARMKTTQNKHKTRKCHTSEMKKCKITISVCNTLS